MNIKLLALSAFVPLALCAADPIYYAPLDDTPDVIGINGKAAAPGLIAGARKFVSGISGKGLDSKRHAYDQATLLYFTKWPAIDLNQGTISFWFKPHWKETDDVFYPILTGRDRKYKGFRFYLLKSKKGYIELSVFNPKQNQLIGKNLFTKEKWHHVAFTWNTDTQQAKIYINGALKLTRTEIGAYQKQKPVELNLYTGYEDPDRFKATVGNGVYDEIKVFNQELSPADIFVLATGGDNIRMKEFPLSAAELKDNTFTFGFQNKEGRLPGPQKLLMLTGNKGNTITFTAMGSSGKLSMVASCGGKNHTVASSYILNLSTPHKMVIDQNGNELVWKLDDAVQAKIKLEKPFGKIVKIQGTDGIQLASPENIPAENLRARLEKINVTPLERKLWDLKDAWTDEDGVRKSVCLNGYWRVAQCNEFDLVPPSGEIRYMRVPGSFRSPLYKSWKDEKGELKEATWTFNKKSLQSYRSAWHQRVFKVPANLTGKRLYLRFDNINGNSGRIYLNGKLVDEFRQDFKGHSVIPNRRRVDITDVVSKTGDNLLTVFVDRAITSFWNGAPCIGDHQEMALGDVFLEQAPDQVFIKTAIALSSFRKKELLMRTRIANPFGKKGPAQIRYDFSMNGKLEKSFTKEIILSGEPEQLFLFNGSWKNAMLWDVENPNCYKMSVTLNRDGEVFDTFPAQDFGFRECWVENGEFRMNGNKMRMRLYTSIGFGRMLHYYGLKESIDQYVQHIKFMNYDGIRSASHSGNGSQVGYPEFLQASDRLGLYHLYGMIPYEDENKDDYYAFQVRFIEEYGNHPCIIMWATDFNTCCYAWNQDPSQLNNTTYDPPRRRPALKRAYHAAAVMNSLDPTRETFQHAGGNAGKIYGSMNYQSFGTPIQEQMDWPAQWSAKHTQPLFVAECAFPYPAQFIHFSKDTLNGDTLGFLTAEHAARFYGDSVFAAERFPAKTMYQWTNFDFQNWNPNYLLLSEMMYRKIVPAWRAYDMSALGDFPGERDMVRTARSFSSHNVVYRVDNQVKTPGLKPDQFTSGYETQTHPLTDYSQPGVIYKTIRSVFEPLYVQIGGDPAHFTEQGHAYWSEEEFRKTIVVVNDRSTAQKLECRWELRTEDGTKVCSGKETIKVDAGGIVKCPIELEAPEVFERTNGTLKLTVLKDGVLLKKDSLALQFFPKRAQPDYRDVNTVVFDPVGKTSAMLKKAGYPFKEAKTIEDIRKARTLIIGQEALGMTMPELLKQIEREKLIECGLKVLIFEQKQCGLGNLVFTAPSYRDAFIRRPDSLYLAGLKAEDFSNWRGDSDTVPAFVTSEERSPHYPRSKWKCGNGGIVSGNVIRKPGYGNFTPIVDCGFNLMFTSLMELRKGHGMVLFCQLDVTSRFGKDPVATKLTDNMLTVISDRFKPIGPVRTAYIGNEAGAKLLDRMGMEYTWLKKDLWKAYDAQVVIFGKTDKISADQIKSFKNMISKKTTILLSGVNPELLPYGIKVRQQPVWRASIKTDDLLLRYIPDADFYFRSLQQMPVYTDLPDWAIASKPAILAKVDGYAHTTILMPPAPNAIQGIWNDEKMTRIWNAVLNEMNIGLGKDLQLFTGDKACANTITAVNGDLVFNKAEFSLDMQANKTANSVMKFSPILLGKTWEEQGFTQKNPYHVYPANTPESMKQPYDGYAWYRFKVKIPESWKNDKLYFVCDNIDDCDWTWCNGTKIGETSLENNKAPWSAKRRYLIPSKIIKFGGENVFMIRVFDRWGGGGILKPVHIISEHGKIKNAWSPYIDNLDFYDVDAFHNW